MEKYRGGVFYKNNDRAVWEQTSLKKLEAKLRNMTDEEFEQLELIEAE